MIGLMIVVWADEIQGTKQRGDSPESEAEKGLGFGVLSLDFFYKLGN